MYTYTLKSFDGRQSLPRDYTSLAGAKDGARRMFGWSRCYAARYWQAQCDPGADTETYQTLAVSERPSELDSAYCPVIERRKK